MRLCMRVAALFWPKALIAIGIVFFSLLWLSYYFTCLDDANSVKRANAGTILSPIFVVTPTYRRPEQLAELVRLGQTFVLAGGIHWIVVEDANSSTPAMADLLARLNPGLLGTTHLYISTPSEEKLSEKEARWRKVRGVHQRNAALSWLREHVPLSVEKEQSSGVLYFADDDNTYDIRLFEKMRNVKKVGVWPVGLVGKVLYEGPICDVSHTKVIAWRTNWLPDRFCACDMAGFAVNLFLILKHTDVYFSPHPGIGMLEADFLARLVFYPSKSGPSKSERMLHLEPLVCNDILVWHTQTKPSDLTAEVKVSAKFPADLLVY